MSSAVSKRSIRERNWIRLFVSSTFRGMRAERRVLLRQTFPQLQRSCRERGVLFEEVDYSWGITEEQVVAGEVLSICLQEIDACRPFFIGIVGDIYGSVPEDIPPDIVSRFPWLEECRDRSVTEIEMLHGALNDPGAAKYALFYVRNPQFPHSLPPDRSVELLDLPTPEELGRHGYLGTLQRMQARGRQLDDLRKRIFRSGLPVRIYDHPEHLGELVVQDVGRLIGELYPRSRRRAPLDVEAVEQNAYADNLRRVHVERPELLARLDAHVQGEGPPLVVVGEAGAGKSALLAQWVSRYRTNVPNALLIDHFVGGSLGSSNWRRMLRRILSVLKTRLDLDLEISLDAAELREFFRIGLKEAAERGRLVLVLDGLDDLEDRDQALDLVWLPQEIPPNARLILSCLPGRLLKSLEWRSWPTLLLVPLRTDERRGLITSYLERYGKKIGAELIQEIISAKATSNPLFLTALLTELRVCGEHARLPRLAAGYLSSQTVEDLYTKILRRYERDYGSAIDVPRALLLLSASRRGLSEMELLDLLGDGEDPLPQLLLRPFYAALEAATGGVLGLVRFNRPYLRDAVLRRYRLTDTERRYLHIRLADYFVQREDADRIIEEVPWQIARSEQWDLLAKVLSQPEFLLALWQSSPFDALGYWNQIERATSRRVVDSFESVLRRPERFGDAVWAVAALFAATENWSALLPLADHLLRHSRRTGDLLHQATALALKANSLTASGDLNGALDLLEEQERICSGAGNRSGVANALAGQAVVFAAQGDGDQALALLQDAERISREVGDRGLLPFLLIDRVRLLEGRGTVDEVLRLLEEAERLSRELANPDGIAKSVVLQAHIYSEYLKQPDRARALLTEARSLLRRLGPPSVAIEVEKLLEAL